MLYTLQLSEEQTQIGAFEFGGYKLPPFLFQSTIECEDDSIITELLRDIKGVSGAYMYLNQEWFKVLDGKKVSFRLNNSKPAFRDGGQFTVAVKNNIMCISRAYIDYAGDDACDYTWVFQEESKYQYWNARVNEGLNSERLDELKSAVDALKFNGMTVDSIISQIKKWEVM